MLAHSSQNARRQQEDEDEEKADEELEGYRMCGSFFLNKNILKCFTSGLNCS